MNKMTDNMEKDNAHVQFEEDKEEYGNLSMDFHPTTLEHLGIKAYTTIHAVISELISNSWDADAEKVRIEFRRYKDNNYTIFIIDDGEGMDYQDIQSKFLQIGENRRKREKGGDETKKKRRVTGRKGIGKLAIFGVVDEIEIISKSEKKEYETYIKINLEEMLDQAKEMREENEKLRRLKKEEREKLENQINNSNYFFTINDVNREEGNIKNKSGTIVKLTKFKKARLPKKDGIRKIADAISRQLPLVSDDQFSVEIHYYEDDKEISLINEGESNGPELKLKKKRDVEKIQMQLPLLMEDIDDSDWGGEKEEDFIKLLKKYEEESKVWSIKTKKEEGKERFGTIYIPIENKEQVENEEQVVESVKKKSGYHEIRYWFGFYKKPIKDRAKQGITIYCRRKLAQEPFFFLLEEGAAITGFPRNYITGEIIADWLDDGDDAIATNRRRVNWELEKTQSLLEWGRQFLKQYAKFWTESRRLLKKKKSVEILRNTSMMSPIARDMANRFASKIDDEGFIQEGATQVKLWISEAVRGPVDEMVKRLLYDAGSNTERVNFTELYNEQVYLARQLAIARYKTVHKILHDANAKNEKMSLRYVKILRQCPWILSPEAIVLYENKEITEELRILGDENNFNPPDLLLEKDSPFYGETEYYIIKVKMSDFTEEDIEQFIETVSWFESLLDEKGYTKEIYPVLIGNKMDEVGDLRFSSVENGIFVTQKDIIKSMNRLLLLTYIYSEKIMENPINEKFAGDIKHILEEINVNSDLGVTINSIVDYLWDEKTGAIREEYKGMIKGKDITKDEVINLVYYEILAAAMKKV